MKIKYVHITTANIRIIILPSHTYTIFYLEKDFYISFFQKSFRFEYFLRE